MGRRKVNSDQNGAPSSTDAPETRCPHIDSATCAQNTRSLLNPRLWACCQCGTTERVWACLFCSFMGCGRDVGGHALLHHQSTKHAVAMEVNDMYIHCYICNCYVLNDNIYNDLETLRRNMRALATRSFETSHTRSGRRIRSEAHVPASTQEMGNKLEEEQENLANQVETADTHFKAKLLARVMAAWRQVIPSSKVPSAVSSCSSSPNIAPNRSAVGANAHDQPLATAPSSVRRKPKSLASGVTGLRNLGNTCYMNSVLQALGHVTFFRECFRQIVLPTPGSTLVSPSPLPSPPKAKRFPLVRQKSSIELPDAALFTLPYARQTTIECFNQLAMTSGPVGPNAGKRRPNVRHGLNGGGEESLKAPASRRRTSSVSSSKSSRRQSSSDGTDSCPSSLTSLVRGLHQLFRVTWSGKWTVATPSSLLISIWRQIPSFHGHEQQDAQEFLSQLLERLEAELCALPRSCAPRLALPRREVVPPCDIIRSTFQGELLSEVTCQTCGTKTSRQEVFYDMSLDFPDRYQARPVASARSCRRVARPPCQEPCDLQDLLKKFVSPEQLDPIFLCETCLGVTKPVPGAVKRRMSRSASVITAGQRYQPAIKRLLVANPPEVLRLHLKRFRWFFSSREKINVHVRFPMELNMRPYCASNRKNDADKSSFTQSLLRPVAQKEQASADDDQEEVSLKDVFDVSGVFGKRPPSPSHDDSDSDDDVELASDLINDDYVYDLSSVVMHHGSGFNRGHYTSYCWNHVAKSWVHCNDARLTLCSEAEAMSAQAYILFYVRRHGRAGSGRSPFAADTPAVPPPLSPASPPFSPFMPIRPVARRLNCGESP